MKKFLICLVLATWLFCGAWTWYRGPDHTLGWDAVTTMVNGDPIPSDDIITYEIYIRDKKTGAVTVLGYTGATTFDVSLVDEGRYDLGVCAIRTVMENDAPVDSLKSNIAWSDNPAVCYNNEDFGVIFYIDPSMPGSLKGN